MRSASQWLACALLVLLTLACVAPIRSYDFFWHLATGRWIAEHRALPMADPFAIASDRTPWINGEWLFDWLVFVAWRLAGFGGLSWIRAGTVAALFAAIFLASRRSAGTPVALLLSCIAFAGAHARLDVRPLTLGACFVAAALVLAEHRNVRSGLLSGLFYVGLTIVWINIHPSALLAPVIAAVAQIRPPRLFWLPFASAAALLINPFGFHAIAAPIALTSFVSSGAFVNKEWLPSDPRVFPLLYVTLAIGIGVVASARRREEIWRYLLFAMFAALAIRSVRHQPLYFSAFPILLAPSIDQRLGRRSGLAFAGALSIIAAVAFSTDHRPGIDATRFPVEAAGRLGRAALRGNIYNPDQFGGFLIWSFYPDRRVLTDGRNELYQHFIPEYARARVDSRAWRALLARYRIDLAIDEYRAPLEVIDARTQQKHLMPASLAYFPRQEWALIGYDQAAMAFARRSAFDASTIAQLEVREVPDR